MAQRSGSDDGQQTGDRFDAVPRSGRVGAHRVNGRPRYVWQYLIAGLLGFALLTGAGVLFVNSAGNTGKLPLPTSDTGAPAKKEKAPEAVLDPDATIAVLNGTPTSNLAAGVVQVITENEWGDILFAGTAADTGVAISAVFYTEDKDASAAEGLAKKLGGLSTYKNEAYNEYDSRLVVLLGADYAGPGFDEATAITEKADSGSSDADEPGATETPASEADAEPAEAEPAEPAE